MKYPLFSTSVLTVTILLSSAAMAVQKTQVLQTLVENAQYLFSTQVQCEAGNFQTGSTICFKGFPGERRILGSWDSVIVPFGQDLPVVPQIVDSNIFVTAHTVYPLFFLKFENKELELKRQKAIADAMQSVNLFQRNEAFAFWTEIGPSLEGQVNRIGPLNLSPLFVSSQFNMIDRIHKVFQINLIPESIRGMKSNLNLQNPQIGIDAIFNVPNDGDDTALGIVSNFYYYQATGQLSELQKFSEMTLEYNKYVDSFSQRKFRNYNMQSGFCREWMGRAQNSEQKQNLFANKQFLKACSLDDPREHWRYEAFSDGYSKAFMTWFYNEKDPIYAQPEKGLVMPGQNSVDCNALTNILYSLSLTEQRNNSLTRANYENSCMALAAMVVDEQGQKRLGKSYRKGDPEQVATWKYCGLFYPSHMTFPYLLSKAIAEARTCQDLPKNKQKKFDQAVNLLVQDLIQEQDEATSQKKKGQWYESIDKTVDLPTALGGVALLNFKKSYSDRLFLSSEEWKTRINLATERTLQANQRTLLKNSKQYGSSLGEGTFFGGGTANEIAHWRSRPFSTAVSLELMQKYLLTYDLDSRDHQTLVIPEKESPLMSQEKISDLPVTNIISTAEKEEMDTLKSSRVSGSVGTGLRVGSSTEAIVGIELSIGSHYRSGDAVNEEKVAYYHVKLKAESSVQKGADPDYFLSAQFIGIQTKSNFNFNSELAFLPIRYIHLSDVEGQRAENLSAYLLYGEVSTPLLRQGNNWSLNLDFAARALGLVYVANRQGQLTEPSQQLSLAEVRIAIGFKKGSWSVGTAVVAQAGQQKGTTDADLEATSTWESYITYEINRQHKVSLFFRKGAWNYRSLFVPGTGVHMQYQYFWDR